MKAPANCRLIGRWRIVEADLWDRAHLDLCGPATLTITAQGGEIAFGALEAGLEVEYARDSIGFPLGRLRGRRRGRGRRNRRTPRRRHSRDRVRIPKRRRSRPQSETGHFFNSLLGEIDTVAARALESAILTAGRSGEVYGARWTEFDLDKKVWTIPAERMKAGREHRVPLCRRVAEIVEEMARVKVGQFVFPGRGSDKPLSHVAMAKVIDRVGATKATVHGFHPPSGTGQATSTFRARNSRGGARTRYRRCGRTSLSTRRRY